MKYHQHVFNTNCEDMTISEFCNEVSNVYEKYMDMADEATRRNAWFRAGKSSSSYVYFITDGELTKVGISTGKISSRISQLQCGNGRLLIPLAIEFCAQHSRREHELHKLLCDKRKCGEWFDLTMEDVLLMWEKYPSEWQCDHEDLIRNMEVAKIIDNRGMCSAYEKACAFTGSRSRYGHVYDGEINFDDLEELLYPGRSHLVNNLAVNFVLEAEKRGYDIRIQTGTRRQACDIAALREYLKSGIA